MKTQFYTIAILCLPLVGYSQFTFHEADPTDGGYYVTEVEATDEGVAVVTRGDNVLCLYDDGEWVRYDAATYGFTGNTDISAVSDFKIFFDTYWIAYRSTIDILNSDETVTTLNTTTSELQGDNVKALAFNNNFTGFFAYQNSSGISTLRLGEWTHDNNHSGDLAPLNDIFRATLVEYDAVNDKVWIYDGGDIYSVKDDVATKFTWQDGLPSLGSDDVTGMATTADGKVWFSINDNSFDNGGLLVYDGVTWEHLTSSNSDLPDDDISAVAAHGNNILIGGRTTKRLSYYNGSSWTTYTDANSNYPDFGPQFFYDIAMWGDRAFVGSSDGVVELDLLATVSTAAHDIEQYQVTLQPNPTADILRVASSKVIDQILLYATTGKLLGSYAGTAGDIDVSDLPAGTYSVTIHLKNGDSAHKKLVKI